MAVLSLPDVLSLSALSPAAVFSMPSVLLWSARAPVAVFRQPAVLLKSENAPLAVLLMPLVLLRSDWKPVAVFLLPAVLLRSDWKPVAVLLTPLVRLISASTFSAAELPLPRSSPAAKGCRMAPGVGRRHEPEADQRRGFRANVDCRPPRESVRLRRSAASG